MIHYTTTRKVRQTKQVTRPTKKPLQRIKIEVIGTSSRKLIQELKDFLSNLLREKRSTAQSLSVIFVDNNYIRSLNRKYLGRNRVTDVLAFPFDDKFLGEVYIGRQQAKKQARQYGVTEKEEILHLAKHGVLHLLGYHHLDAVAHR